MPTLSDGTVLPHFLGVESIEAPSMFYGNLNDNRLLIGDIIASYPPDDPNNRSKKFYEYDVLANDTEGGGVDAPTLYHNCIMTCHFGTAADYCRFQPRFAKVVDSSVTYNTKVVIKCVASDANQALIVGFYRNPYLYDQGTESIQDGPYYEWQYNGINAQVNSDGELTIKRKGPLDIKGVATDTSDKVGFQAILNKDGGLELKSGDSDQIFQMDHPGKKLFMNATNGIKLGGDSEHLILGNTYRQAEDVLLQQIFIALQIIMTGMTTLSGLANSTPITAHLGPGFDAIQIGLAPIAPAALTTFSAQAAQYLSLTNTTK